MRSDSGSEQAITSNDKELWEFLQKWKVKKESFRAEWDAEEYQWCAKYVSISFEYKGKYYSIYPKDIGLSDYGPEQGFMEFFQKELSDDLRRLGATHVRNYGFID